MRPARELYIVEGDSALGSRKAGPRQRSFRRIMPVRGKILNCLKADYDKIFKNDIITDLLKVLGCGVEVRGKAAKDLSAFDLDKPALAQVSSSAPMPMWTASRSARSF